MRFDSGFYSYLKGHVGHNRQEVHSSEGFLAVKKMSYWGNCIASITLNSYSV